MFWLQLIVLLALILVGARLKGIGLGIMGALGTLIYVYLFNLPIGSPPIEVMLIILCVVTAAASMQVSGGMDYMVSIADKIIRKNPKSITFIGPFVTFFFTFLAGTAHISYSIIPIIAEVSAKSGVRPERPLSISVIAAHMGITASPISAATVAMLDEIGLLPGKWDLVDILMVTLPASLIGIAAGAVVANFLGKDMDKDTTLTKPAAEAAKEEVTEFTFKAKLSVVIFLLGVVSIVLFGLFPQLGKLGMIDTIQLIMLSVVLFNVFFGGVKATEISKSSIFRSGAEAVLSIFGVVWMSNTFIGANGEYMATMLQDVVQQYSWVFALALFLMSALLFSQAATVKAIMPLGIKLGIIPPHLIAMYPATNGIFTIPSYPTIIAAINFDKTGSTHVGKFLVNHSFMLPGLVTTAVTVLAGFVFATIML